MIVGLLKYFGSSSLNGLSVRLMLSLSSDVFNRLLRKVCVSFNEIVGAYISAYRFLLSCFAFCGLPSSRAFSSLAIDSFVVHGKNMQSILLPSGPSMSKCYPSNVSAKMYLA